MNAKNIIRQSLDELTAPEIIVSLYSGDVKFYLDEIEEDGDRLRLYLSYWRKYYQAEAKLKSGAMAGWSRANKHESGVPLTVTIDISPTDGYDDEEIIEMEASYRGQFAGLAVKHSSDGLKLFSRYSEIDSQTVAKGAQIIFETILSKLSSDADMIFEEAE